MLSSDEVFAGAFNCKTCTEEEKIANGCKEPVDRQVWKIDFCLHCFGEAKECEKCDGSNETAVNRCPRAMIDKQGIKLLPYFFENYYSHRSGLSIWPDGLGRYYQPVKLVTVFEILSKQLLKIEERRAKKD